LSQQLIHLQEEERKSLARDLHDELGQYLTAIRSDAAALLEMSKTSFPAAREGAQAIVDVTLQVMEVIGAMLQRLRPEVLDELGLQPALMELIATWRQRNRNVSCIVRIPDNLPVLDEPTNITAYRVVQECLTNVARHAKAKRIEIELKQSHGTYHGNMLEIHVADDGIGFDPATSEGFGLSGMRERVVGLGGKLEISSIPGNGARVSVWLPIKFEESV
jgi:two-component system sensor histidine kinase UhpB